MNEDRIRQINRQMQPHFIFNSLTTIRALCKNSPEAVEAINAFAGFLRGSIDMLDEPNCIPVKKELDTVRHYLNMEQKRFGQAIQIQYDLQDEAFSIPPFTVQTMVENAIKHGIRKGNTREGTICVRSYETEQFHVIEVMDDGVGYVPASDNGLHTGIANTKKRLALMCNGMLEIQGKKGSGTIVKILVPKGQDDEMLNRRG